MKRLFAAESLRWRILLRFAAWAVLIVLIFASAPFLFDVLSRGMEWIAGLFPHPDNLWKECSWCF